MIDILSILRNYKINLIIVKDGEIGIDFTQFSRLMKFFKFANLG